MLSRLQDNIDEFRRFGAQVVGISVDPHHSQAAFARERGFSFPMLSDFNKEAMAAFDIAIENQGGYRGVDRRSIFIVRPDRTVVHADVPMERGVLPDVTAALARVRDLAG